MKHAWTSRVVALAVLITGSSCSSAEDVETRTVIQQLVDLSSVGTDSFPPLVSFCGSVQPGFDMDTYDPLVDTFCTINDHIEFSELADGTYEASFHLYVSDMGEPDPAAMPESWHCEGCYYCRWTSRVTTEPYLDHPQTDIQKMRTVIESAEGPGNCPNLVGLEGLSYIMRGTDPTAILFVLSGETTQGTQGVELQGGVPFRGFEGVPERGGSVDFRPNTGGHTEVWKLCDPVSTEEGPGYCRPDCRLFEANDELPLCDFEDHYMMLPANRDLIDATWASENADIIQAVFGSE